MRAGLIGMRAGLALCLLAAGCGAREVPVSNGGANEAEIQRLSTPKQIVVDTEAAARLRPLAPADLDQAGMVTPLCDFSRDGRMLLAVSPSDAIARVAGTLHHFAHSSPAGPTGGFFEDRQVSISVGRVGEVVPGEGAAGSWPGRITATNRRAHAQIELDGLWRCGE
jgi:hypothetical protein